MPNGIRFDRNFCIFNGKQLKHLNTFDWFALFRIVSITIRLPTKLRPHTIDNSLAHFQHLYELKSRRATHCTAINRDKKIIRKWSKEMPPTSHTSHGCYLCGISASFRNYSLIWARYVFDYCRGGSEVQNVYTVKRLYLWKAIALEHLHLLVIVTWQIDSK